MGLLGELVLHLQCVLTSKGFRDVRCFCRITPLHFLSLATPVERGSKYITVKPVSQVRMAPSTLCSRVSLAALAATAQGFNVAPQQIRQQDTSLNGFGDAFKGAFSNDDTLGAKKNEGLAGGPVYNDNVTINGKAVKGAVVGQKLTVVAGLARVKIPVNCQKGDCGTCEVNLNGRKVKACQTVLGKGKCAIQTL